DGFRLTDGLGPAPGPAPGLGAEVEDDALSGPPGPGDREAAAGGGDGGDVGEPDGQAERSPEDERFGLEVGGALRLDVAEVDGAAGVVSHRFLPGDECTARPGSGTFG